MINKKNNILTCTILFSFLIITLVCSMDAYSEWMGLYHDKQHSARTDLVGPDYPDSLIDWKFKTEDQVISTPVVGPAEYFYDANLNGIYDEGEQFLDYNGNRTYDNGTLFAGSWDNTLYSINTQREDTEDPRVYWSYELNDRITASPTLGPGEYYFDGNNSGSFDPGENFIDGNNNGIRDRNTLYVPSLDGNIYAFYSERAEEGNFDFDGNGSTDDVVRIRWIFHVGSPVLSACVVDAGEPFEDANGNGIYDLGENFTDIYLNGVRDGSLEEPFVDRNSNGRYDAYLNETFTDLNSNGIRDGITIYFTAFDGRIYALNEDGSLKWATLLGLEGIQIDTTPAVSLNGERVFVTSPNGYIYAIDASGRDVGEGEVIWSYKTDGYINASPSVGSDNSVMFGTGYPDNKLYCFTFDGELKYQPVDLDGWIHSSPAIGADGTVYIAVADYKPWYTSPTSRLVAVSEFGEILWTDSFLTPGLAIDAQSWLFSSPIIDNNALVYFTTSDNNVFAIHTEGELAGELKWHVKLFAEDQDPPLTTTAYWLRSTPVLGPDESFYVGSTDSYIYGLGKDIVRPNTVEPAIWTAGFAHGPISTRATELTIEAEIWDPEGNISLVEVYDATKTDKPVIGNMEKIQSNIQEGTQFYRLVWEIPNEYFPGAGQYFFEIQAFDAAGHESDVWPHLTVHEASGDIPDTPTTPTTTYLVSQEIKHDIFDKSSKPEFSDNNSAPMQGDNSPPEINLAGFYKTYLDSGNGGTFQILAYVRDLDGTEDIESVEIYFMYSGIETTIDITNLAVSESASQNSYLFEADIGSGIPAGDNYHIVIIATDSRGNTSTWPYLEVN